MDILAQLTSATELVQQRADYVLHCSQQVNNQFKTQIGPKLTAPTCHTAFQAPLSNHIQSLLTKYQPLPPTSTPSPLLTQLMALIFFSTQEYFDAVRDMLGVDIEYSEHENNLLTSLMHHFLIYNVTANVTTKFPLASFTCWSCVLNQFIPYCEEQAMGWKLTPSILQHVCLFYIH